MARDDNVNAAGCLSGLLAEDVYLPIAHGFSFHARNAVCTPSRWGLASGMDIETSQRYPSRGYLLLLFGTPFYGYDQHGAS